MRVGREASRAPARRNRQTGVSALRCAFRSGVAHGRHRHPAAGRPARVHDAASRRRMPRGGPRGPRDHRRPGSPRPTATGCSTAAKSGCRAAGSRSSPPGPSRQPRKAVGPDLRRAGGILAPGLVVLPHREQHGDGAAPVPRQPSSTAPRRSSATATRSRNVLDAAGIEMMLEDARQAPLSIFLTVDDPGDLPARDRRRGLDGGKDRRPVRPLARGGAGRRWTSCRLPGATSAATRSSRGPQRGRRSRHLRTGVRRSLRGERRHRHPRGDRPRNRRRSARSENLAVPAADRRRRPGIACRDDQDRHELGASPKRVCVCTDDRDADDLLLFGSTGSRAKRSAPG